MRDIESKIQSVADARYFMKRTLPTFLDRMYENGTGLGATLKNNVRAFEDVSFLPQAAVSHKKRGLSTTLLGHQISMPVVLAPVGALRTGRPGEGELAVARAAGAAGTIQSVSTFTGYPIEDVVAAASGPVFFQLFFLGGRANTESMIDRAQRAGCAALVVTVDIAAPALPRERPYKERVHSPTGVSFADGVRSVPQMLPRLPWLRRFVADGRPTQVPMALGADGEPLQLVQAVAHQLDEIPTWDDIAWIREQWNGPIILKGILTAKDALRARDVGVQGIVVSNHGGNHLDGGIASLQALPRIAAAVPDLEIVIDGGVRRGSDVVKALALGANAVQIGRGYVYPLMAAGEAGVKRVLDLFMREIDDTLASLGCASVQQLNPSYVQCPESWGKVGTHW
ncbi:MAG: alpha-hydroxy-acid oxidizing protein [Hyphomicrobiales bacterium]|nr:MAG: alpha-hydroxy-acid oxidizing protein [Hyphomicrobiales bacterium]